MVFVYMTCKDKGEANKISKHLLTRKLVACTNSFPIESSYWWEGKIVNDMEYVILAKTVKKHFKMIEREVKGIISYTVPCICLIQSKDSKAYNNWLKASVKKGV